MTGHDFKLKRSLSVPIENRNVSKWLPIPFDTIRKKRITQGTAFGTIQYPSIQFTQKVNHSGHDFKLKRSLNVPIANRNVSK